ncbi:MULTISPECIES: DUF4435 domain-containing protein [unclassified Exiguobacterium]|uniref:DUF4435 domain-containing protein n=1 Tax=unclassified Exiguobacterium TaxID=2644629 RepID=UPI001BE795E3|nr:MULTISPECIES: DUF4435 domain-containing protein [unclassified Exiguobacterium]
MSETNELDYKGNMVEETKHETVIYHELLQTITFHNLEIESSLFSFHEGLDDLEYYPHRIRTWLQSQSIDKKVIPFQCGGRKTVKKIYFKLALEDSKLINSSLFFIDRDFNFNEEKIKKMYVTPGYSIENLYADVQVLNSFLEEHAKISNNSIGNNFEEYKIIEKFYEDNLMKSLEELILLNAWYSLQMNKKKELEAIKEKIIPDLKKIKKRSQVLNKLNEYGIPEITIEFLEHYTINPASFTETEFEAECNRIKENILFNTRGKYVEEIISDIYKEISKEMCSPSKLNISIRPITNQISVNSIKRLLSHHAITPNCLFQYLQENVYKGSPGVLRQTE